MRLELRPRTALVLLVVALVVVTGGSVAAEQVVDADRSPDADHVAIDDKSVLWPYTSRAPTYADQTLSINVVIYGDAEATETIFRERTGGDWREVEEDEQDVAPAEDDVNYIPTDDGNDLSADDEDDPFAGDGEGLSAGDEEPLSIDDGEDALPPGDGELNHTSVAWGPADGATRYTNVEVAGEGNQWLTESYQLHDGDYLGKRHHVRAYVDPVDGEWTVIQAHQEHWDWFHLRHTVHSVEGSQQYVEEEFLGQWYVDDLRRERFGNDGAGDANGWVTVVDLEEDALRTLLFGFLLVGSFGAARWTDMWHDEDVRTVVRALLLVVTVVGLYSFVRFGAVGAERLATGLNPKLIVVSLYPILVVGIPSAVYLLARKVHVIPAFASGTIGVVVALFLDYTYLGVTSLPIDTVVHRIALAVAIGFIAAGASKTARRPMVDYDYLRTGVLLWLAAIAIPLLQFV